MAAVQTNYGGNIMPISAPLCSTKSFNRCTEGDSVDTYADTFAANSVDSSVSSSATNMDMKDGKRKFHTANGSEIVIEAMLPKKLKPLRSREHNCNI